MIGITLFYCRLHLRKLAVKRLGQAASRKVVSNLRSFKNVAEEKLVDLTKTKLKRRTEAKMMWGVRAYNDWCTVKLSQPETFDVRILHLDLNDCKMLNKVDFEYSMCRFIAEVVKVKDGTDYPGSTLYQMCVAIQKFLFSKGLKWKLIEGEFENLRNVLDNTMKEHAAKGIGMTVQRAEFLSNDKENFIVGERHFR